jgi:hypothetical protein
MHKHTYRTFFTLAAIAGAVLIGTSHSPRRAEAQPNQRRSVIDFFTVQAIARNNAQIPTGCDDVSMLSVSVPSDRGASIPGVVVLCERR